MIKGRAWIFGDDVDTDAIIPGRYLTLNNPEDLAKYLFDGVRPDFREKIKQGDIIVAGENFGCGSSREHAPLAIKYAGISCVVAKSFARIFFRNSINLGLPPIECRDADKIDEGDEVEIDLKEGIIKDLTKGMSFKITPIPEFLNNIMREGLLEYTKKRIKNL
ncbi:MAG: 3-isopropylmalate dehydratase small subunit [Candidatus Methanoliparum thermophilum]|uniref:3-isopropylmalate dehydratase small subunit n=1 Tax=Methanoliparum thermophilum TaxID=2491083 RepID=A0A520KSL8_METT2|nr:3-isopropylmalate dehydratase small subunit [Candidatus Methanoliparum sp. LAM-1]RZN64918.1 MAG: 3-isopropylmalate dehydratase small subunit [Candidatus Methanoliparum thermophilum]BDC36203.1 3-isopropylmalate dehydratase small subunit [Candidatus Methanoliparum sp. LAM-1]